MSYEERNVWVQVVVGTGAFIYYVITMLGQLSDKEPADISYQRTMLMTIGVSIGASIVGAIVVAIIAGITTGETDRSDQRDKEIARFGSAIGYYVVSIGAAGALILTMLEKDYFWIANALFFSLFAAGMVEGITRLVAYRRGL